MLLVGRGVAGLLAPVVVASVMVLPLVEIGALAVLAGLFAIVLLSGTVWWLPDMELGSAQAAAFALIGLGAALLPRLWVQRKGLPTWPALMLLAGAGTVAVLAQCQQAFAFRSDARFRWR